MIIKTPTKYFLVAGSSEGYTHLNAFDGAIMKAGVGNTNLLKMSSILPPSCQEITRVQLPYGALIPIAYASISSDLPNEVIASAVAVAIPEDPEKPGLIMEYSSRGHCEDMENIVRDMAQKGMEMRNEKIREIQSISSEHKIVKLGATFAGVVLWD